MAYEDKQAELDTKHSTLLPLKYNLCSCMQVPVNEGMRLILAQTYSISLDLLHSCIAPITT